MKFTTAGDGFVQLDAGYDGSDFTITISVSFDGFSGKTETWVPVSAWRAFVSQLIALESSRRGVATLSAPEAEITIRALDAEHLAVEGFVAAYEPLAPARLTFAQRSFDASDFPRIVRELRNVASDV